MIKIYDGSRPKYTVHRSIPTRQISYPKTQYKRTRKLAKAPRVSA